MGLIGFISDFAGSYLVLLGFTRFDWVLMGLIGFITDFAGSYLVLLGLNGFNWV